MEDLPAHALCHAMGFLPLRAVARLRVVCSTLRALVDQVGGGVKEGLKRREKGLQKGLKEGFKKPVRDALPPAAGGGPPRGRVLHAAGANGPGGR